ncbi:MAG: futalosine hydrolase [Bacteroidetes bacterium]|nr:futalosine hydrolase [Bacteroidota bacterium]
MKILLVSATPFEIMPTLEWLEKEAEKSGDRFKIGGIEIVPLITGVGLVATTFHLGRRVLSESYDLLIQAGIAGSFRRDWEKGRVFQIVSERFGDLGAETAEGGFLDLFEMELESPDGPPFSDQKLKQPEPVLSFLPTAEAISVQKVHGSTKSIEVIQKKYDPDLESMEGAAFFYVCLQQQLRFLQLRAISNYVEARNRENWDIPLAIGNLNQVLREMLVQFKGS